MDMVDTVYLLFTSLNVTDQKKMTTNILSVLTVSASGTGEAR